MQVRDDPSWTEQVSLLENQDEPGPTFLKLMVFWVDTAEKMMEESTTNISPANAIRLAFPIVENEFGNIDMLFFGQLMLVISMHWIHGTEFANTLTTLEMKNYSYAVQLKQAELQAAAERAAEPATEE